MELARLRVLCPGAELWEEAGGPLVYLPGLAIQSGGAKYIVDALLSPRPRDGYDNKLYFASRLPVARNWSVYGIMAKSWHSFSWRGNASGQSWLDILAGLLEAAK